MQKHCKWQITWTQYNLWPSKHYLFHLSQHHLSHQIDILLRDISLCNVILSSKQTEWVYYPRQYINRRNMEWTYKINRFSSQIETNANLENRTLWFALFTSDWELVTIELNNSEIVNKRFVINIRGFFSDTIV